MSDRPYDPIRSPSQGDLRPHRIDSIPEDSTLSPDNPAPPTDSTVDLADGYVDMDINDVTVQGGVTPARDVMALIEAEAAVDSSLPPSYGEATHEQTTESDASDVTSLRVDAADEGRTQSADVPVFVVEPEPEVAPHSTSAHDDDTAPADDVSEPVTSPPPSAEADGAAEDVPATHVTHTEEQAPVATSSRLATAILVALVLFVIVCAFVVLETDLDLPLFSNLRSWPHVSSFRESTYIPLRASVARLFTRK